MRTQHKQRINTLEILGVSNSTIEILEQKEKKNWTPTFPQKMATQLSKLNLIYLLTYIIVKKEREKKNICTWNTTEHLKKNVPQWKY